MSQKRTIYSSESIVPNLDYGKKFMDLSSFSTSWVKYSLNLDVEYPVGVCYLNERDPNGGGKTGSRLLVLKFSVEDVKQLQLKNNEFIVKHTDCKVLTKRYYPSKIAQFMLFKKRGWFDPYAFTQREINFYHSFGDNGDLVQGHFLSLSTPYCLKAILSNWSGRPPSCFTICCSGLPKTTAAIILEKLSPENGWKIGGKCILSIVPRDILYKIAEQLGQFHGSHYMRDELQKIGTSVFHPFATENDPFLTKRLKSKCKELQNSSIGNEILTNEFIKWRDEDKLIKYNIPTNEMPKPDWLELKSLYPTIFTKQYEIFSRVFEVAYFNVIEPRLTDDFVYRHETIVHGDCHGGNYFYKRNNSSNSSSDNKDIEVAFFDFQFWGAGKISNEVFVTLNCSAGDVDYESNIQYIKYWYDQVLIGMKKSNNTNELFTFNQFIDDIVLCMLGSMRKKIFGQTRIKQHGKSEVGMIVVDDIKLSKMVDKKIQNDRRIQQLKVLKEWAPGLDNGFKRFISFMTHSNSKHITDVFDYYQKCGGKSREELSKEMKMY
eukprot:g12152.t1